MSKWTMVRMSREAHDAIKARADESGCSVSAWLDREYISAVERAKPRVKGPRAAVATVEHPPPSVDPYVHTLSAPPEKFCSCGGRGGMMAPYRKASRRHTLGCSFYDMKEE